MTHTWEPYTGILTAEPYASQVQAAGLGPHTRTCSVCGLITSDDDNCDDLQCSPDGKPRLVRNGDCGYGVELQRGDHLYGPPMTDTPADRCER